MPPSVIKDDGTFEYVQVSKDNLEGGLEVMRESFFLHENVCIAVELPKHPNAAKELEELCLRAARDGVSLVAIEKGSGKVVGVAFNKMQIKGDPGEDHYFEKFAANCKEPSSKSLVLFMKDTDETFNLFEHCNVDCLLEIMFLATLPEYRGREIGKKLCEASISLTKTLLEGQNIKHSITDESLKLEPTPKIVSAIFTSNISQTIAKKLGFVKATEISFDRWTFNGKKYSERIGPITPFTTLEYKRL